MNSNQNLSLAIENESRKFEQCYRWLENSMPAHFFEEISHDNMMLITHNLMGFNLQDYFCTINLKQAAIVLCLDSADADLKILANYAEYGIKNYMAFVSHSPPPFSGITSHLRIGIIYFTEAVDSIDAAYSPEEKEDLKEQVMHRNRHLTDEQFDKLIKEFTPRFLRSLPRERLILALDMYFRAKSRDNCQYEVRYQEKWKEKNEPSLQIVLAWRNTPKYNFLYRLALLIHRNGLVMKGVNATYIDPYSKDSILVMSLSLHGAHGEAAWEAANIPQFLRELATVKYFPTLDLFETKLVSKGIVPGFMGNLLRAMTTFIHQALVHVNSNIYTYEVIEEGLTRHPELTKKILEAFKLKFHPQEHHFENFLKTYEQVCLDIARLDTGNEEADTRRKNILQQAINMVYYCLKTNLYQQNYTAIGFRMDPSYLEKIPFDRSEKFPEIPYAIFFIKGMHYFGYHIRFKDLARGGLRTVYLKDSEIAAREKKQIFTECYQLAYTQHMKNKDIPEGGAKGIIFLESFEALSIEAKILQKELLDSGMTPVLANKIIEIYMREQKLEQLYQTQRSFIETLITLVNCDDKGSLRAKHIVDYLKKPEYLYLGPDENMHDSMIQWIAMTSKKHNYRPGSSFISGKPENGINHKEYGITSRGLNVYVEQLLNYVGIDPKKIAFTIKMSGGPDGDVAGNEILILAHNYPDTAKILSLIDVSGTIFDPNGLDLQELVKLFHEKQPIRFYPPQKLSAGGFLLDKEARRQDTALSQQTLLWKNENGTLKEEWISSSEMNAILKNTVHQTKADIFIPAGGRPRTLNETNYIEFLDETGRPTSELIVEGANLYMTAKVRQIFEGMGVLIIKDSSANKTGVICSSFEVLAGLTLGDELFVHHKEELVQEILVRIQECAFKESQLLLKTHEKTEQPLTEISQKISERINQFSSQLMDYLEGIDLPKDPNHPLIKCFLDYCLPLLRNEYQDRLLANIPDQHKKACIACHIASELVYKKGLQWFPSVVDILPLALKEIS